MTVAPITPRVVYAVTPGDSVRYPVTFTYTKPEYVYARVVLRGTSEETQLDQGLDWVFTSATEIQLITTEYNADYDLVIYRQSEFSQETDWEADVNIAPQILEGDFDYLTLLTQELQDELQNTLRYPANHEGSSLPLDPETLDKVLAAVDDAEDAADRADASASSAALSETNANQSAIDAANSASAAYDSAASAVQSETNASIMASSAADAALISLNAATQADASASAAAQSETNADQSAIDAAASAAAAEFATKLPDPSTANDGDVPTIVTEGGVKAPVWLPAGGAGPATPTKAGLVVSGGTADKFYKVNAAGTAYGFETVSSAGPLARGFVPAGGTANQIYGVNEGGTAYEFRDIVIPTVADASETVKGVAFAATATEAANKTTDPSRGGVPAFITPENLPEGGGIPLLTQIWSARQALPGFLNLSLDNGLISRSEFPEAWAAISQAATDETAFPLLSETDWQAQLTANGGVCGAFSSGDGSTTFRVPLIPNMFVRGGDPATGKNAGMYEPDQMRPITGSIQPMGTVDAAGNGYGLRTHYAVGALTSAGSSTISRFTQAGTITNDVGITLDSALLGTNFSGEDTHPVNVTYWPMLKMADAYEDASTQNIAVLAQEATLLLAKLKLLQGKIDFLPFRPADLAAAAPGWYFCNGDQYALSSPQGQALDNLPANFKSDWGVVLTDGNISLPNMFYSDGRGYFMRGVDGTTRRVGSIEEDALQNISGSVSFYTGIFDKGASGLFSAATSQINSPRTGQNSYSSVLSFNAANVARTSTENRPINIGMTPAIYLGV